MAQNYSLQVLNDSANTPSISSAATALEANRERSAFFIQNLGTNPLYVRFGAGASTTVFHIILKGCVAQDDGSGGSVSMESVAMYNGIITVAGTSPRYTAFELGVKTGTLS